MKFLFAITFLAIASLFDKCVHGNVVVKVNNFTAPTVEALEAAIQADDANETELLFDELFDDDDIETKNKYLYAAAEQCKPEVAKKLIEKGADVNSTTGADKWRPIHGATYNDCLEVAKILIENKADVNAKIRIGYSSLHIAAHNGRDQIAKLLLENGADVNITDSNLFGRTAKEWAKAKGHQNVVDVITNYEDSLALAIKAEELEKLKQLNDFLDANNLTLCADKPLIVVEN